MTAHIDFAIDFQTDDRYIERARLELGLPASPEPLSGSELRDVLWCAQVWKDHDKRMAAAHKIGKGIATK